MPIAVPDISDVAHIHDEIRYLQDLTHRRIQHHAFSTKVYRKTTAEQDVVRLLARYHKYPPFPADTITPIVASCLSKKSPITICFALTNCRSRSKLKCFEHTMLPHYGWLYLIGLLTEIEQYGQLFYASNTGRCFRFCILDETPLVQELLYDNPQYQPILYSNQSILQHWIQQFSVDIRIIPLDTGYFPIDAFDITSHNLPFDHIYSYACSIGFDRIDRNPILMDPLYTVSAKNEQRLIALIGPDIWGKATEKAAIFSAYSSYRKAHHLAGKILHTDDYIDTTVLRDCHRFNLRTTSPALLTHGMPVIRRGDDGAFWINILPEYRIRCLYPDAQRVPIQRSELIPQESGALTFFYLTKLAPWEKRRIQIPTFDDIIPAELTYGDLN